MLKRIWNFITRKNVAPTPLRVPNYIIRSEFSNNMYDILDEQSQTFGYELSRHGRIMLNPDGSFRLNSNWDNEPKLTAKKIVRNLPEWF